MNIAILGWGSLLWDQRPKFEEFERHHGDWQFDGPHLKLEFSRVSSTRDGALTLVLDPKNGKECQVAYAFSKRDNADDSMCDLRCREGTTLKNIGVYFADDSRKHARDQAVLAVMQNWARKKAIDVVIWTDLPSNFNEKSKCREPFSVESALRHIQALGDEAKANAAEYVWRAPSFVKTPLREALQSQPWFQNRG